MSYSVRVTAYNAIRYKAMSQSQRYESFAPGRCLWDITPIPRLLLDA